MKKFLSVFSVFVFGALLLLNANATEALKCFVAACPSDNSLITGVSTMGDRFCESASSTCYQGPSGLSKITTCNICESGTIRILQEITVPDCGTYEYYVCQKNIVVGCDECEDCESTDWETSSVGMSKVDTRVVATCDYTTCI